MVKKLKKPHKSLTNTINSIWLENKTTAKSRQQIYSENYQKNKEIKKAQRRERYAKQKEQEQLSAQKYYQARNIQILLTLKEYSELNKEKHKIWLDFAWVLKDLNEKGILQIEEVMKLRESAENLIKDYRETAINKTKKGQNWNSSSEEEKNKLIKYWANEKVRKEQELNEKLTAWENQAKEYEKEPELAKFHEERGKIKCECWQCAKQKELKKEIKEQILNDYEKKEVKKEQCSECQRWVKEVDEENGMCTKCLKSFQS